MRAGRVERGCRAAVAGIAAVLVIVSGFGAFPHGLVVAVPAGIAAAAAVVRWSRRNLSAAVAVTVAVSLVASAVYRGPQAPVGVWGVVELWALLVLIGRVARRAPPRRAVLLGAGLTAALLGVLVRSALRSPEAERLEAVVVGSALSLVPVAGVVAVALYLRGLDDRRVRAVAEARRAQRLALARDLHDFVAHEVTGIALEAQAAQLRDLDAGESRAVQGRIEQAALRALESMDETLHALRDPSEHPSGDLPPTRLYGLADLPELVGRFPGAVLDGAASGHLSREAHATAYRVVLEALTNVRRHAARSVRVAVSVRDTGAGVELRVRDDGGGRGRIGSGLARVRLRAGGTGLAGLDARVRALGGTFSAGRDGDGWTVACTLPIRD